jgi:CubicO group peptidase (beta-lactamase class C family)
MNRLLHTAAVALACWAANATAAPASLNEQLEQRAERFFADSQPGGVVLVRRGDEILLRKAYGLADVENGVPMRPDAVMRLASVSKQFTAMAVLTLVHTGKLELDQPVGSIDASLPPAMAEVTLRQLLTHTSGITNISSIAASRAARRNDANAEELIGFFKDLPLEFEPGTQFSYSNSNYIVLTRVIELASGKSYPDYLRDAVLKPLGMNDTRYGSHLDVVPRRAQGYQQGEAGLQNADFISMSQPQGAGGLLTTVDDLARWDAALYTEALVPAALRDQAFAPVTLKDGSRMPYGFGWLLSQVQGLPSQEHSGYINGFQSQLVRLPGQKVLVTVFTNSEALFPGDLAVELAAMAGGVPYDFTPVPVDASAWLGRYRFEQGVVREILSHEGKIYSRREGSDPIELTPTADGRFYLEGSLNYLTFVLDAKGQAQVTLHDRMMGDSVGQR